MADESPENDATCPSKRLPVDWVDIYRSNMEARVQMERIREREAEVAAYNCAADPPKSHLKWWSEMVAERDRLKSRIEEENH